MTDESAPEPTSESSGQPTGRTFAEMNLHPGIEQALDDMGFSAPMQVQDAIYDRVIAGEDLMVQSRTGSGKTAAFGIPMTQLVPEDCSSVFGLALAPTRELALQIAAEIKQIGVHRGVEVLAVYGGAPIGSQIQALKTGKAHIIAGTPGRVLDHLSRRTLDPSQIRFFVLDECDEMFSMGFQEDIERIARQLPAKEKRQTLLFSATIPPEIERIGKRHMRDYKKVMLSEDFVGVHEIDHAYYLVSGVARTKSLLRVIADIKPTTAIIFCNTRGDTSLVAAVLQKHGYDAEAISGDLTQKDRERVMTRTKNKEVRFLCATDIAARGIDISDLSHVINYTFPESPEVYIHRTGRTGRAGKSGAAISLVGPRELGSFYHMKLLYKIQPRECELPTQAAIDDMQSKERIAEVLENVTEDAGSEFQALAEKVWQHKDGQRIIGALLKRLLTITPAPGPAPSTPPPEPERDAKDEVKPTSARTRGNRDKKRTRRRRERKPRGSKSNSDADPARPDEGKPFWENWAARKQKAE